MASGHWDADERPIHNLLHYSGELNLYSILVPHDTQHIPGPCRPLLHRAHVDESFTIPSQHTLGRLRKQLVVLLLVGLLQHTADCAMDPLQPTSMPSTLHQSNRSPWTTSSTRSSNYIRAPMCVCVTASFCVHVYSLLVVADSMSVSLLFHGN